MKFAKASNRPRSAVQHQPVSLTAYMGKTSTPRVGLSHKGTAYPEDWEFDLISRSNSDRAHIQKLPAEPVSRQLALAQLVA